MYGVRTYVREGRACDRELRADTIAFHCTRQHGNFQISKIQKDVAEADFLSPPDARKKPKKKQLEFFLVKRAEATMADGGTTTTIIRVAPNGTETRLQRYYRERVENLEAERAEIVKAVLDAAPSQEEVHKARWDLIVKQDELEELQRALGKANLYLLDQKKLMLVLKAENESLASENELQSRQINHLMSLLPPSCSDEVTFFQELVPSNSTHQRHDHSGDELRTRNGRRLINTPQTADSKCCSGGEPDRHGRDARRSASSSLPDSHLQDIITSQAKDIARLQEKLHAIEALSAERAHVLEESFTFRAREVIKLL